MSELINFIKSVKNKLTDKINDHFCKGDGEMTIGDITEDKRIGKNQSIHVFGLGKYGEKKDDGSVNGGCFCSGDLNNGAVIIGCEGKENTKNGVIGAQIAQDVALTLIKALDKECKNEGSLLKHIASPTFKAMLKTMWQELITIRCEELQLESVCFEDYATSVTIGIITENHYIIGGIGEGGVLLYNEFEGKRVLTGNKDALLLGEGKVSLLFREYSRSDFGGLLFLSKKLGTRLYENRLLHRFAIQLDKRLGSYVSESPLNFNEELKNIIDECGDSGLITVIASDRAFRLPDEKYREYKEATYKKQREEAEKNRQELIKKNLELAKNKELYDTYEVSKHQIGNPVSVFKARRQGRSHIEKDAPCQDYCMSSSVSKGIILADADGLGSCKRSQIGSRLACEAVIDLIKLLDSQSDNEEIFVSRLQGAIFRERLVNNWLGMVVDHIQENPFERENANNYLEYASTLMFAVITENYYVVGCLGDGQVLLFNDYEGVKLRLHDSKEDTATKSLVNHNCAREDFVIGKYNRSDFSGVLLTTDGMYDGPLSYANALHRYATEIQKRFTECGEPQQPFCYTSHNGEMMDLYSHRTMDDCSIVLAVDSGLISSLKSNRIASLKNRYGLVIPQVLNEGCSIYFAKDEKGEYTIVASKNPIEEYQTYGIEKENRLDSFVENGYYYSVYNLSQYKTLDQLYQYGELGEKNEDKPNASRFTLKVYDALKKCIDILDKQGYYLTDTAGSLMLYNDGEFMLYPEAIAKRQEGAGYENKLLSYFDVLLGRLVNGRDEIPLFKTGFKSRGQRKYLTEYKDGASFAITTRDNKYYIENTDIEPWLLENGDRIEKGEKISLDKEFSFKIRGEGIYRFIK